MKNNTVVKITTKHFPPFFSHHFRSFAVFFLAASLFLCAGNAWGNYWIYTWKETTSTSTSTGQDTDWTNQNNWTAVNEAGGSVDFPAGSNGPAANGDVVIIPKINTDRYPEIKNAVDLLTPNSGTSVPYGGARVTIETGAKLTITSSGSLTCGTITNNGTLINEGTLTSKSDSVLDSIGNIINNGTFISTRGVTVTGTDAASGTITGSGTYEIGGTVTTTGTQRYDGTVTVKQGTTVKNTSSTGSITFGNTVSLENDLAVETSGGTITFNNTINGTHALTLSAGTGSIRFTDTVGTTVPVGAVTVQSAANVTADKEFCAKSFTQVTGSGTTEFNGKLTTTEAVSLTGGAFTFSADAESGTTFSVNNSGLLKITGNTITANGAFTQTGVGGAVRLGSDVSAEGPIDFTAPVTLTADVSITVTGTNNITFAPTSVINSDSAASRRSLTFRAESGTITLSAVGDTTPLQNITLSGTGSVTTGTVKIAGNWENTTIGTTTVSSIDFISSDNSNISGNNTFTNFTCTTAGKTLYFEAGKTQTIGNLSILGTSVSKINLRSKTPGTKFTIAPSTANVRYADIKDSENTGTSPIGNTAYDSIGDGSFNNSGWTFANTGTVRWIGRTIGSETNWNTGSNWSSNSVPTSASDVIIPATSLNKPILASSVTVANLTVERDTTINGPHTLTVNGDAIIYGNLGDTSALTSFTVTGTTSIKANVTTTGAQTYNGAITLEADTTLESTNNGAISFSSTVNGGFSLTLVTGGSQTFGGAVGNTAELITLSTGSGPTTVRGGTVKTTENQTYTGAVTLGADTTMESTNNGAISFSSTVNGGSSLTLVTGGSQTFYGAVGNTAELTTLSTGSGPTTVSGGTVKTTGNQVYNGAVTLGADTSFSAFAGNLQFNAVMSIGSFTIKAVLSGDWNGSITVSEIEFIGSGISTISGTNTFNKFICKTAGKTIQFPPTVTTIGDFEVVGTQANPVKLNRSGGDWNLHFKGTTGTFALPNMEFVAIENGKLTTGNSVYAKNSSGSGTNITGKKPYWIFANTGLKTWTGAVSAAWSAPGNWKGGTPLPDDEVLIPSGLSLSRYPVLGADSEHLKKITIESGATVNVQTFTLTAENAFVSGSISRTTQISGSGTLKVTNLVLDTNNIHISAKLAVLGTTDIETTEDVSLDNTGNEFKGVITAAAKDFILKSTLLTSLGIITATGMVEITSENLEITGNITTDDGFAVKGTSGSVRIGADIVVTGNGSIQFEPTAGPYLGSPTPKKMTTNGGNVHFNGVVNLGDDLLINTGPNAGNIIFDSTINGAKNLTLTAGTGNITFDGAVGTTGAAASLSATAATININGGTVTTAGSQTYTGAVTLGAPTTLTATNSNISFSSAITNTTAQSLVVTSGGGNITFAGEVGTSTDRLASLTTTDGTSPTTGVITISGGNIWTTGAQTYTGPVALSAATTLTATNGNISFGSAITNTTAQSLVVTSGTGNITFDGAVGTSADRLASLTTTNGTSPTTGVITISGGNIWTTGAQTYTGPVALSAATTLTAINSNISFGSAITNTTAQSLVVASGGGNITFDGAVGTSTDRLASLTTTDGTSPTTGVITISGGNIWTTGTQTYTGPIALGAPTTLSATNGNISFDSPITNTTAQSLVVTSGGGNITFDGAVGTSTDRLASLTTTDGTSPTTGVITISGGNIWTTGTQTYTGAVSIGAVTTLSATNANVTFNNAVNLSQNLTVNTSAGNGDIVFTGTIATINGAHDLVFSAGTGDITFGGAVGTTGAPVGKFTVTSARTVSINNDFFQTKTTTPATDDFIVTGGTIAVGTNTFIAGNMKLDGGTFTQTGSNPSTNTHSVGKITLASGATMKWAQTEPEAGDLTITGDTITAASANQIDFGFKNVTFTANITLGNLTLYDLLIQNLVTVTLNDPITVRRNVTIENGGKYVQTDTTDILTLGGATTTAGDLSVNGAVRDENDGTTNPKQNLGTVIIDQGSTTKTFATNITAGAITISGGTDTGSVTFDFDLTADTFTNSGGAFNLLFNGDTSIENTASRATINTTGKVTFRNTNTFNGGLSIASAPVDLGGKLDIKSGGMAFPNTVTLGDDTKIIAASGNISFGSTIDGTTPDAEHLILTAETGGVSFTGVVGGSIALDTLHITSAGTVTQSPDSIVTADGLILEGAGTYTLDQDNKINKLFITSVGASEGEIIVKNIQELKIAGITRQNSVSVTLTAGNLSFTTNPVSVTGANSILKIDTSTGNGQITFNKATTVDGASSQINLNPGNGKIEFNGPLTAEKLAFVAGAYSVALNNKDPHTSTIIKQVDFNTTGVVTLNTSSSDKLFLTNGLVFSAVPSKILIGGLIDSSGALTFNSAVETQSETTQIKSNNTDIIFSSTIDNNTDTNTDNLVIEAGTGSVTFTGAVGAAYPLESVSVKGANIHINGGTVITDGSQTYTGKVTIDSNDCTLVVKSNITFTDTITLKKNLFVSTEASNASVTFPGAITGTNVSTENLTVNAGTGNVIFKGAVGTSTTPLGSVTIESASTALTGGIQIASHMYASDFLVTTPSNVFISGASTFSIGGAGSSINFPSNLFIAAGSGNAVSFNKDLRVANSIALFSGNVSLGGNLTATTGDIVLLKGNASTMFKGGSLEGLFGYNAQNMESYAAARGTRTPEEQLTAKVSIPVFPNTVPDGTAINHTGTAVYSGSVTIPAGKTVSAGQNFYANGVDLIAASWTLELKDNESALSAFAEAYNLTITNCTVKCLTTTGSAWLSAAENCTDTGGVGTNTNVAFSRPKLLVNDDSKATGAPLSGTYTIYDDVIRVEFVDSITGAEIKIENTHNEISKALANTKFNGNSTAFTASFTNPDCTISTDGAGDLSVFYLKTNGTADQRWNTDATGTTSGDAHSTDRGRTDRLPEHRTVLPTIDIPTALATLYQTLRDEHKNRIATVTFTDTADRCRPVVVEVRTGQEVHKPFASQAKYDAHNFIEIRYSEPVTIPQFNDPALNEYVKSQSTPSATVAGGAIAQNGAGLDISGFMNLANGILDTGAAGVKDNEVHALYRNFTFDGTPAASAQSHRVRISIAGWTSLSTTGYEYPGYIDNAVTPSGAVTVVANRDIRDNSTTYKNAVEPTVNDDPAYGTNSYTKAAITVDVAVTPPPAQDLYGKWDVAPPVAARFNWNEENDGYEIVGNSNAAGYVGNFEFHFFDNTPDYSNPLPGGETWQYSRGWGTSSDNPIRPDTVGGSRPEYVQTPTHPKTQGGLRATTINQTIVKNAFSLHLADQRNNIGFDNINRYVTLNKFFGDGTYPLSVTDDTLYLSLTPTRTDLRSRETYDVIYDSSKGFITDLAGNRLKSALWQTVDRTPPKISMTVTPYDDMRLFVFFNKKIELEPLPAAQNAVLSNIHQEFLFFNKFINPALDPDESLAIPDLRATKAELVFQTADATGLILTLSRKVTYTELSTAFISLKKHTDLQDITGPVPAASNITDKKYNWMNWNDRIPVTYFGVNTIKPLYATDGMVQTGGDTKEGTTVVIRGDFDGSGQLYYDREISMQVRLADGVTPQTVPEVFIDAKPNPNSVSLTFNKNSGKNLSFWLPNLPRFPYLFISPEMNTHAVQLSTGTGSGQLYTFKIPVNTPEREPTDTLQFIFKHGEIMTPDRITGQLTVPTPFYHIRLNNAQDPSELSLFTFKVLSMLRQRGGSTILNNVIQAGSEEAVLEVIMPKQGNLTVSVMTLDGNVVKHLYRGTAAAGTHYLRWNGTNASGRAVARGMYFVRIIGPNIDETRKIMVVKD